jgi:hypothetical protein
MSKNIFLHDDLERGMVPFQPNPPNILEFILLLLIFKKIEFIKIFFNSFLHKTTGASKNYSNNTIFFKSEANY